MLRYEVQFVERGLSCVFLGREAGSSLYVCEIRTIIRGTQEPNRMVGGSVFVDENDLVVLMAFGVEALSYFKVRQEVEVGAVVDGYYGCRTLEAGKGTDLEVLDNRLVD